MERKNMKTLTEKIDLLINETEFAYKYPDERSLSKYKEYRAIQFLRPWNEFRTGDRADVYFGKTLISIVGTNSEGYFAGIKKSHNCTDPEKQAEFKSLEGNVWFFV